MNYEETLSYLYSQLPMFTRVGKAAYKANLDNTLALVSLLGHPENKFRSIHIAGTNGKGSTSHMLAAILQEAGYKTGLYTSPHLLDFRERIRVNGRMIPKETVVEFVARHSADFERIRPSFFEMCVALCFHYFAQEQVDIAVIETGLGGRLDSTNVITPELSVITNISNDHADLLGDTLEKIAVEKAGIIKPRVPVVIGERASEAVNRVFENKATEAGSQLFFAEDQFRVNSYESQLKAARMDIGLHFAPLYPALELDLTGHYQQHNIRAVLQCVEILRQRGFRLQDEALRRALKNVKGITGLRGRWEILGENPLVVADVAHNEAGLREVMQQLASWPDARKHFVLGFVNDKDLSKVLPLLPKASRYYFCKPPLERGLDALALQQQALAAGLKGNTYASVQAALQAAREAASTEDLVYIGGSTFVVSEALN